MTSFSSSEPTRGVKPVAWPANAAGFRLVSSDTVKGTYTDVQGVTGTSYTISINYPFTIGLPGMFGLPAVNTTGTMTASATERLE